MHLSKFTRIVLILFAIICAFWLKAHLNSLHTQDVLQKQFTAVRLPASCVLQSQGYNDGDLDNPPQINARYTCNDPYYKFEQTIEDSMKQQGFQPTQNNMPELGSFEYSKQRLYASYRLNVIGARFDNPDTVVTRVGINLIQFSH